MNERALVSLILLILTVGLVRSQEEYTNYMRMPDGTLIKKVVTSATTDGGMIMATLEDSAFSVTRLDDEGGVTWSKRIRTTSAPVLGNLFSVSEIDGGPGFCVLAEALDPVQDAIRGMWIVEVNAAHEVILSKYYCNLYIGGSSIPDHYGEAYRLPDGGYLLYQPGLGNVNYLYGIAPGGDTLYCRVYSDSVLTGDYAGGESTLLNDNSILLLNRTDGGLHLMRVGQDGEIIWGKTYLTGNWIDDPWAAVQLQNDSILITGLHGHTANQSWGFLLQMDTSGNIGWHRRFDLYDQENIFPGFPLELTASSTGGSVLHIRNSYLSFLAQFNSVGVITSVDEIRDERIWLSDQYFYRSMWPMYTSTDRLNLAGAVEYFGGPWSNDSIFVASLTALDQMPCGLSPVPWYDEPFPGQIEVVENGVHRNSTGFRTGELEAVIEDQEWIIEPFCFATNIGGPVRSELVLSPSVVQRGIPVVMRNTINLNGGVQVFDPQGRAVLQPKAAVGQDLLIETYALAAGLYTVGFSVEKGQRTTSRFVVVEH